MLLVEAPEMEVGAPVVAEVERMRRGRVDVGGGMGGGRGEGAREEVAVVGGGCCCC